MKNVWQFNCKFVFGNIWCMESWLFINVCTMSTCSHYTADLVLVIEKQVLRDGFEWHLHRAAAGVSNVQTVNRTYLRFI